MRPPCGLAVHADLSPSAARQRGLCGTGDMFVAAA
jgi:hypothetical protein